MLRKHWRVDPGVVSGTPVLRSLFCIPRFIASQALGNRIDVRQTSPCPIADNSSDRLRHFRNRIDVWRRRSIVIGLRQALR